MSGYVYVCIFICIRLYICACVPLEVLLGRQEAPFITSLRALRVPAPCRGTRYRRGASNAIMLVLILALIDVVMEEEVGTLLTGSAYCWKSGAGLPLGRRFLSSAGDK
jgi:hypothetical protein